MRDRLDIGARKQLADRTGFGSDDGTLRHGIVFHDRIRAERLVEPLHREIGELRRLFDGGTRGAEIDADQLFAAQCRELAT